MKNELIKASIFVMSLTIISKLIGFVKSIIQASFYGSTIETDVYNVAYGAVGGVVIMIAMAIAIAYVPLYIQELEKNGREETKKTASRILTVILIASIGLGIVLFVSAPIVIKVIAPSYTGDIFILAVNAYRIMVLGISFALGTRIYDKVLNSEHIFGFPAIVSVTNSAVVLICIICGARKFGIYALIVSVPVSWAVQFFFLYLKGRKFASFTFKYGLRDQALKILMLQMFPILVSNATVEINQIVDRALLTNVETGAVTAVSYSSILYLFANNVIISSITSVVFTDLSEYGAQKDLESMSKTMGSVGRIMLELCLPVTIIMLMCSDDIVRIVYGHGNFSEQGVIQCSTGLTFYALCLFPDASKNVLSRAFYSLNDTRLPMILGIGEVILNIILSIALSFNFGIAGVVGATFVSCFVFMIVMFVVFTKKYVKIPLNEFILSALKIFVSGIVMIISIFLLKKLSFPNIYIGFFCLSVLAMIVYCLILVLLKDEYTISLLVKIRQFFMKNKK